MSFQLYCTIGEQSNRFGGEERVGIHSAGDSVVFVAWTQFECDENLERPRRDTDRLL